MEKRHDFNIRLLQEENEREWKKVINWVCSTLKHIIRSKFKLQLSDEELKEVLSDTLVKMYSKRLVLPISSNLHGYMVKCALNACYSRLKHVKTFTCIDDVNGRLYDASDRGEQFNHFMDEEFLNEFRLMLKMRLTKAEYEVITCLYFEKFNEKEASEVLCKSLSCIKKTRQRALIKIRSFPEIHELRLVA